MPASDFFTRLGLFCEKGFLGPELCAGLCAELRAAPSTQAEIYHSERQGAVDRDIRSSSQIEVPAKTIAQVNARLGALRPALGEYFHLPLSGWENVNFLRYAEGDFFLQHRDSSPKAESPGWLQARQVSIVVFLNQEGAAYTGGNLTFYGLMTDPRWATFGFPLQGETGLLVAFRSNVLHEVAPVIQGERFTMVTWFY
jgi:SM-20-related protein